MASSPADQTRDREPSERLVDEMAINATLSTNEAAITTNDCPLYVSTFTDDAEVLWWDGRIDKGREAIGEFFKATQIRETVRDVIVNVLVEFSGPDDATAIGSGITIRSASPPAQLLATATITSKMRRDPDGKWRIRWQEKRGDPSFNPEVGSIGDVVAKLEKRVAALEDAGAKQ